MRWAICRASTQVKVCTAMLLSVQWNIGENATWWGSLSCRKPNSISDLGSVAGDDVGDGPGGGVVVVGDQDPFAEHPCFQRFPLRGVDGPGESVLCGGVAGEVPVDDFIGPAVVGDVADFGGDLVAGAAGFPASQGGGQLVQLAADLGGGGVGEGPGLVVVRVWGVGGHDARARSFPHTPLTKVGRQLDELAATLG